MKTETIKRSLFLFLTACIWGVAFVAQSVGMDYVGPFTFNAVRFFMGGTVLLPFLLYEEKKTRRQETGKEDRKNRYKVTVTGGICCGLALCSASLLQQKGIMETTVAKAGFITALYIIIVPLFGLFLRKRPPKKVWAGVVIATVGMYLLCINEAFTVNKGDVYVFMCALLFSVHILVIDYFSPKASGVALSCIQFYTCSILCGTGMLFFETFHLQALLAGWIPVLYTGILSCGVAYTLQIIGQKNMEPTVASLILSLESVISLIAGWIILGQALSLREMAGCAIVFFAIVLVQL